MNLSDSAALHLLPHLNLPYNNLLLIIVVTTPLLNNCCHKGKRQDERRKHDKPENNRVVIVQMNQEIIYTIQAIIKITHYSVPVKEPGGKARNKRHKGKATEQNG
ncbi:TPA: hypothetical protein N2E47_002624 [Salmonella enterica]|nr:hypothetical protein [Salmonella enterica]